MSDSDMLNVSLRNQTGTRNVRRLRRQGLTPAILYGHGKTNVNLAIPTDDLESLIRHGVKMVSLGGEVTEKALIRAVQWDAFGLHVVHLDLNRVSETERVEVSVPIELRGESPGSKLGGILEQHLHDVEIECPAGQIPDKLKVSLKELELGESIALGSVPLPENVKLLTSAEAVIVHCQMPGPTAEDEEGAEMVPGAGEPEVIGRKAEDAEESSD